MKERNCSVLTAASSSQSSCTHQWPGTWVTLRLGEEGRKGVVLMFVCLTTHVYFN